MDGAGEQTGSSTRTNEMEHMNNLVVSREETDTLIKEEKRKKQISKDSSADAPLELTKLSYEEQMAIIELFKAGKSYGRSNPEIQELTGFSGKLIFSTIEDYKKGIIQKPIKLERENAMFDEMLDHIHTYIRVSFEDSAAKADVESLLSIYMCEEVSDDMIRSIYQDEYNKECAKRTA